MTGMQFRHTSSTSVSAGLGYDPVNAILAAKSAMDAMDGGPVGLGGGMEFMECLWMCDSIQVRFPRSKKKRIRKKWRKKKENWGIKPGEKVYVMDGIIIAHPVIIQKIKDQARKESR
jgi:hypothetical protein